MAEEQRVSVEESKSDEGTWAALIHLSPLISIIISIPFMNILAPLVLWLIARSGRPMVNQHGKQALTFKSA